MDKRVESDSSSSEDESCMEALKEAADHDIFKNVLLQTKDNKINAAEPTIVPDDIDSNNDQYTTHGLTQSCRAFIAKKLIEKLNTDIVLEHAEIPSNNVKNISQEPSGIKLFSCSNAILTDMIDDDNDEPRKKCKKKRLRTFDEKTDLLRCKEVALEPQTILSQNEVKYWIKRKQGKEFKYKKTKNGVLLQID